MEENQVKVYELAKELGTDSISLLDVLKSLSIEVKSHMSSLSAEDVQKAKDHFNKPKQAEAKTKAKTTKSATPKAATKTTATKTAAKTTRKKAEPAEAPVVAKKSASTVIRRRSADTGEMEIAKSQAQLQAEATAAAAQQAETTESSPDVDTQSMGLNEEEKVALSAAEAAINQKIAAENAAHRDSMRGPSLGSSYNQPSLLNARKTGMTAKNSGSVLTIIKDEPRKVGPRIIAQPKPVPAKRDSTGAIIPNAGIINLGKDAIDKMAEEEQGFGKKKGSKGTRELDKQITDVKVSDYRAKKELVFLPKKKRLPMNREVKQTQITKPAAHKMVVRMENTISVLDLAQCIGVKTGILIKKLINMGTMATVNQALDLDTATIIAHEYGYEVENVAFKEENVIPTTVDAEESLQHRPPIVTVMGHVDHGKTSLLDAIRSANVAAKEAGGITQHIGAYTVEIDGKQITFIDTPGHEAFTMMRSRGANVTDIVILVVAADDGVMPQTREALAHAKAAGVPIIVAVNKIDKPSANPDRVYKELAELDLLAEEWGGQAMFVKVSALKKTGIKELLEGILLQAEILDLKANPDRLAEGFVLEAKVDKSRGVLANILVRKGTLKVGDFMVSGAICGKVRALTNSQAKMVKFIGPSHAAELSGLESVPVAGDTFNAVQNDAEARKLAQFRSEKMKAANGSRTGKISLEDLFSKVQQGDVKELPIILKTDVFGSQEAIKDSLNKISSEVVKVKVIHASTGGVTESDVMLASASNAIIIAFNVRPETKAMQTAEAQNIEIKSYSIIYELLDDVKKAMGGMLDKKAVEKYLGRAEVRNTFTVPKLGLIAGCGVVDGKIVRGSQARLLRDNRVIYTGKLASLKRFKDDAKEVAQGYECGIGIENFNDIKLGDIIEAFEIEMMTQDLDVLNAAKLASNAKLAAQKEQKEQKEAST